MLPIINIRMWLLKQTISLAKTQTGRPLSKEFELQSENRLELEANYCCWFEVCESPQFHKEQLKHLYNVETLLSVGDCRKISLTNDKLKVQVLIALV